MRNLRDVGEHFQSLDKNFLCFCVFVVFFTRLNAIVNCNLPHIRADSTDKFTGDVVIQAKQAITLSQLLSIDFLCCVVLLYQQPCQLSEFDQLMRALDRVRFITMVADCIRYERVDLPVIKEPSTDRANIFGAAFTFRAGSWGRGAIRIERPKTVAVVLSPEHKLADVGKQAADIGFIWRRVVC